MPSFWKTPARLLANCLVVCVSIAFFAACSGSGAVSAPTATARSLAVQSLATGMAQKLEATDQAVAQLTSGMLKEGSQWPAVLADSFRDNSHNWPVGDDEGDLTKISWEISLNRLYVQAKPKQDFTYWITPDIQDVTDFYASTTARQITGGDSGEIGLIFRQTSDGAYYLFNINNRGEYSANLYNGSDWTTFIDLTYNEAIHPYRENELEVVGKGDRFALFANGVYLNSFQDGTLPSGVVGVAIGEYVDGGPGSFEFKNLLVKAPGTSK